MPTRGIRAAFAERPSRSRVPAGRAGSRNLTSTRRRGANVWRRAIPDGRSPIAWGVAALRETSSRSHGGRRAGIRGRPGRSLGRERLRLWKRGTSVSAPTSRGRAGAPVVRSSVGGSGGAGVRGVSSGSAQADSPGASVIEPKLMPPRVHPGMLRRGRLLQMLDDDAGASFTVVNAAVGYGKTTLVRSWCAERPEPVIWVTLDSADDDAVRLWTHLATAVDRLGEGFGRRALMCLGVRGAPVETAVDELMNGVVAYGRRVTIVLDDLHAVRSEASLRSIAQTVDRLPPNARLVASTRSDPSI